MTDWNVYFKGNFWGHSGRQRPGKEIPVQVDFEWNGKFWYIPSVYICTKGLVVDFCMQIPVEHIDRFIDKWGLTPEHDGRKFVRDQWEAAERDNPMVINIKPEMILNGKTISCSHSCSLSWNPVFSQHNSEESDEVCKHYGLDQTAGWMILRADFPWRTSCKPKMRSLSIVMKHGSVSIPGFHFSVSIPGEYIEFVNPITNISHRLTVQALEHQEIQTDTFKQDDYDFPIHFVSMNYEISPELEDGSFSVLDCSSGDSPHKKHCNSVDQSTVGSCCAVGIIGGADGRTAILINSGEKEKFHTAYSALYFEPADIIQWKVTFYQKPCADITVPVI